MIAIDVPAINIHPPERSRVEVSGSAEIRRHLQRTYGVSLRLTEKREREPHERLEHARVDVGAFVVEEFDLPGDVEFSPDPLHRVAVAWPTDGRVESRCGGVKGEAAAGELTLMAQPDLPFSAHCQDVRATAVLLDSSLVAGVARGSAGAQPHRAVRFDDFRPVDATATQRWKDTVNYVKYCVLADDAMATPLVLGHASRLLAAVTLSTFPTKPTDQQCPHDGAGYRPVLLRRAVEFIDDNVANDIALADIAAAVHVTPRAVQYMFRRHLDTTPLQYLRRIRLQRARQDLLSGDRETDTVTAIAARWGFLHTGRFADAYRRSFGESPHETLRG